MKFSFTDFQSFPGLLVWFVVTQVVCTLHNICELAAGFHVHKVNTVELMQSVCVPNHINESGEKNYFDLHFVSSGEGELNCYGSCRATINRDCHDIQVAIYVIK